MRHPSITRSRSMLLATAAALAVSLFVGVSPAAALTFSAKTDLAVNDGANGVAVADFDNDGIPDLAVAKPGNVAILLGDGSGGFGSLTDYASGSAITVTAADLNGDGRTDLVLPDWGSDQVAVLLNTGGGVFAPWVPHSTGAGSRPEQVAVADFNADGKQDLAVAAYGTDRVVLLIGNGSGGFAAPSAFVAGDGPVSIVKGDFNRDGKWDVATANWNAGVSVLLGTGTGSFGTKTDFGVPQWPYCITTGDFNEDGREDLATANYGASSVSVLLGTGTGSFGTAAGFATGDQPRWVAVGDFDNDGHSDLATADWADNTASVLRGTGTGSLGAPTALAAGSDPYGVAVADLNHDDKQDLVVANYDSKNVSIYRGVFEAPSGVVAINADAAATRDRLVRIDSTVKEATEMRICDLDGPWGGWQPYALHTFWQVPDGDGSKGVKVEYRNPASSRALADSILLDTTAPATTDDAPAAWQGVAALPVHVSFTAADLGGSGVAKTQYKVDGDASWTDGASVDVAGNGTHTVKYRSIDIAGNVEDTQFATVKIDTMAPTVSQTGADSIWVARPVLVLFWADDGDGSGVASIEYSTDAGSTWTTGSGLLLTTDGAHSLLYRAIDRADNAGTPQPATVQIDLRRPTTAATAISCKKGGKATFKFKVTDPQPGSPTTFEPAGDPAKALKIKIKNSAGRIVKTLTATAGTFPTNTATTFGWATCSLAKGSYKYGVYCYDQAGNAQAKVGWAKLTVK